MASLHTIGALSTLGARREGACAELFQRNLWTDHPRPGDDGIPEAIVYTRVSPRKGCSRASPQTSTTGRSAVGASRREVTCAQVRCALRERQRHGFTYGLVKKGLERLRSLTTSGTAVCGKIGKLMVIIADPYVLITAYVRYVSISRYPRSRLSPSLLDTLHRRSRVGRRFLLGGAFLSARVRTPDALMPQSTKWTAKAKTVDYSGFEGTFFRTFGADRCRSCTGAQKTHTHTGASVHEVPIALVRTSLRDAMRCPIKPQNQPSMAQEARRRNFQ